MSVPQNDREILVFKMPTTSSVANEAEDLDAKCITTVEDLKSLRERDKFMYYSIPGVRLASMYGKDVGHFSMNELASGQVLRRSSSKNEPASEEPRAPIQRSRRISFEADPLSILEEDLKELASAAAGSTDVSALGWDLLSDEDLLKLDPSLNPKE